MSTDVMTAPGRTTSSSVAPVGGREDRRSRTGTATGTASDTATSAHPGCTAHAKTNNASATCANTKRTVISPPAYAIWGIS